MTKNINAPECQSKLLRRPIILIACMLAMFMAAIEVTIVATAMPTIIADLGGFSLLGWVFAAYLLTQSISVPIYGRLADLYGRKRIFFIGASLFLLGSVLCGFSPNMWWLIGFRALQGVGAGAITPVAATIIADIYSSEERPRVQGYLASVWGVSAIIGPLMGAFIVQHFNWALIFWVNVPIGILAMLLLARYLPESHTRRKHSLDILGTGYLAISVVALLLALLQAEVLGWWVIPLLMLALMTIYLLIKQEKSVAEPLFPLELWRSRIIVAGNIGGLTIGAAMMGISAFLPTFIQGVMGGSPLEAGMTLALMSIGWPIASTLSGRVMRATSYRTTATIGALLLVGGSLVLLLITPSSGLYWARVASFLIGAGLGMCNTTFLVSVQNAAPYHVRGIATASTMFTRQLGSAVGTAILGATLNLSLNYRLPDIIDPVQLLMGAERKAQFTTEQLGWITQNVASSLHLVFIVSALVSLFTLAASWYIPAKSRPGMPEVALDAD